MSSETPRYFKYLNKDGSTPQGYGKWPLPKGDKPRKWLPAIEGKLEACHNGYHGLRQQDLPLWRGAVLVEIEYREPPMEAGNKVVGRQARVLRILKGWNERTQRLYAADCAERVLHLFEDKYPGDDRPRKAIQALRDFANGLIDLKAARASAADAAAASDAAAAYAAAVAAYAAAAADAAYAAYAAAVADAAYAAYAAAVAAAASDASANAAERMWQAQRILDYAEGRIQ